MRVGMSSIWNARTSIMSSPTGVATDPAANFLVLATEPRKSNILGAEVRAPPSSASDSRRGRNDEQARSCLELAPSARLLVAIRPSNPQRGASNDLRAESGGVLSGHRPGFEAGQEGRYTPEALPIWMRHR